MSSSRDNWERLVVAVVKKQQIWELCHQQSRSPSTISSFDFSELTLSFSGSNFEPSSVPSSPLFPLKYSSISQVKTSAFSSNGSFRSIVRMVFSSWYRKEKSNDQVLVDIPEVYSGQLERFSYHGLQVATDTFNDKNLLGRNGFGKVYKGRLMDGTLVAVKRLKTGRERQFQREIRIFSIMAVHRNLLRLRGICTTAEELLLVYPYMENRSVASCLRERQSNVPPLDWQTRRRIALGSARGLCCLHDHCDPKIIHRDVKAANISLDEEFEAVVGGFSLATLMDRNDTHVTTAVCGAIGHIAPEYLSTGRTSEKTDVFAYGVTLLELITGRTAFDLAHLANDDNLMLLDWVKMLLKEKKLEKLVDPDLQENFVEEEVEQLIQVALLCTQTSALGRPKMSEVVRLLEAGKWDEWHKVEDLCIRRI